jgi:urea transport system ATP-binding protein
MLGSNSTLLSTAQPTLLRVEQLTAGYGESQILTDVTIDLSEGGALCLLGRNGVGKTTLLKTIIGLVRPRSGRILLNGQVVNGRGPHQRARLGLGYVPEGRGIFPYLSVFENLLMGFEARPSMPPAERNAALDEMYTLFPVLAEMRRRTAGTLSGGQQQQLAIARVLVARPKLLLLDEPTDGIQPSIVDQIQEVVAGLSARGLALLLVEQFVDFAVSVCTRYAILERGTVVAAGETSELRQETIDEYLAV